MFTCNLRVQAQYNAPIADLGTFGVPAYRVRVACEYLSDPTLSGSDLLGAMTQAIAVFTANSTVANGCLDITGATSEPEPTTPGAALPPTSFITSDSPVASPEAAPEPEPEAEAEADAGIKFAYQVSTCGNLAIDAANL